MKKIFFSLLAIAAIASCAKTETVYDELQSEVKIKPATSVVTKAAIDGTVYPTTGSFDVYAYWANAEAGQSFTEGTLYIGEAGVAVPFVNKGAYWGGATACYWPKSGSLRFAAYSPASVDMTHNLATDTYSVANYVQSNNTAETVDLLVAPTTVSYNSLTSAQNVSVVFEHALSWITIQVKAKDAASAAAFNVNKVTVNDVVTKGDLEAVMAGEKAMNWTLSSTKANYVVYNDAQALTTEAAPVETVAKGTVVIPQPTTSVTVEFTQTAENGAAVSQEITADLVLGENAAWEAGKHYVYTLVFGLDEILLNPSVSDWENGNEGEISTDPIMVETTEEFVEAVAKGGQVSLQADINLDEFATKAVKEAGVVLNKDIVIEGNGFTVSTTAVRAFQIIDAKNVTIKNLNLVARGERGFQLQSDGQKLVLDNVTAVSNNYTLNITSSGSNAQVTVNNCDFKGLNTVNIWGENANITINNSTLRTEDNADEGYATVCNNAPNGVVTVNGGEVVITGTKIDTYAGLVTTNSTIIFNGTEGANEVYGHSYAINYGEYRYTFATFAAALEAAQAGETIELLKDATVAEGFQIRKNVNVNLNGKKLSYTGDDVLFRVYGAEMTIGGGEIYTKPTTYAGDSAGNGYVAFVGENGTVNITDGVYTAAQTCTIAQVKLGTLNVNGGKFQVDMAKWTDANGNAAYLLNCSDAAYKDGTAVINVNGGEFYKFNPANNAAEGAGTNFLAAGKTVTANGDWFVVE